MNDHDIRFMQHALTLARKGAGLTSPNPMVGCVIVRDGQIVGEGFHLYDWRDHAEIVALRSAGEKARGATLYVNLEPCHHTGRTGPCTEALVKSGVSRVVAAIQDPNAKTEGRGFERLRKAGVEVVSGICEQSARALNAAFARWIRSGKPLVTLKSALTLDGQLALPKTKKGKQREWITSEESRAEVQRMRHSSDALLTGIGTILADNPLLTDRSGLPRRRRLLRVIVDSKLRLSPKSRVVQASDNDLLVFTAASLTSPKAKRLENLGIELFRLPACRGGLDLKAVLSELGRREILGVLLEAGPTLNTSFLANNLVDRMALFYAPILAGAATLPFANAPLARLSMQSVDFHQFGPDFAIEATLRDPYSGSDSPI